MNLSERIDEELKGSLKAKDEIKVSTLRLLKAAISNQAIQQGKPSLDDSQIIEVTRKQIKQRQDSIEAFTKGLRAELAAKETKEAEILKTFLPAGMPEAELKTLIQSTIQELGVSGPSAIGQVMKAVMPKVGGRADGKQVSTLVAQLLQSSQ